MYQFFIALKPFYGKEIANENPKEKD